MGDGGLEGAEGPNEGGGDLQAAGSGGRLTVGSEEGIMSDRDILDARRPELDGQARRVNIDPAKYAHVNDLRLAVLEARKQAAVDEAVANALSQAAATTGTVGAAASVSNSRVGGADGDESGAEDVHADALGSGGGAEDVGDGQHEAVPNALSQAAVTTGTGGAAAPVSSSSVGAAHGRHARAVDGQAAALGSGGGAEDVGDGQGAQEQADKDAESYRRWQQSPYQRMSDEELDELSRSMPHQLLQRQNKHGGGLVDEEAAARKTYAMTQDKPPGPSHKITDRALPAGSAAALADLAHLEAGVEYGTAFAKYGTAGAQASIAYDVWGRAKFGTLSSRQLKAVTDLANIEGPVCAEIASIDVFLAEEEKRMQVWDDDPDLKAVRKTDVGRRTQILLDHVDTQLCDGVIAMATKTLDGEARLADMQAKREECKQNQRPAYTSLRAIVLVNPQEQRTERDAEQALEDKRRAVHNWAKNPNPVAAVAGIRTICARANALARQFKLHEGESEQKVLLRALDTNAKGKTSPGFTQLGGKLAVHMATLQAMKTPPDKFAAEVALYAVSLAPQRDPGDIYKGAVGVESADEHGGNLAEVLHATKLALARANAKLENQAKTGGEKRAAVATPGGAEGLVCAGCGETGHAIAACRTTKMVKGTDGDLKPGARCWKCDQWGHLKQACPETSSASPSPNDKARPGPNSAGSASSTPPPPPSGGRRPI